MVARTDHPASIAGVSWPCLYGKPTQGLPRRAAKAGNV